MSAPLYTIELYEDPTGRRDPSQKRQRREIATARKRLREWQERQGRERRQRSRGPAAD